MAGVLLGAASAGGQSPEPAIVYQAPPDCGSQSEFESKVRARTRSHTLEPTGDSKPSRFEIRLRSDDARVRGSITIYELSGDANTREIEAASCTEAIDGLALIAALTLDPYSRQPEPTAEPLPSSTAPAATPTVPPPPPPTTRPAKPKPAPARERLSAVDLSASGLAVLSGIAPDPRPGLEGSIGFTTQAIVPSGSLLRVGARLALAQPVETREGTATLDWWTLMASLCPAWLPLNPSLRLAACLNWEIYGELQGSGGTDTLNPRKRTSQWAALGPALLVRWDLLPPLFVQGGGEALLTFDRDRFLIGDAVAYEIPPLALRAQLGLGVGFW
jgi:hypothetical protein